VTHPTHVSWQHAGSAQFRWVEADAYLFDIDGTLLNCGDGVHYSAFHSALREIFGLDGKIDSVPVHGNTDVGILRAVARAHHVSDEVFEAKLACAVEHMCAQVRANAADIAPQVCPGVRELLGYLKRGRKLIGAVSGNLEAIGWLKLETAGLRDFFHFGCFSGFREKRIDIFRDGLDEVRNRAGTRARTCFFGDTPSDIAAAQALRTPIIAVATGIYSIEELAGCDPDLCVGCCSDLLSNSCAGQELREPPQN
jgi:phosphoglycolate phosphatase